MKPTLEVHRRWMQPSEFISRLPHKPPQIGQRPQHCYTCQRFTPHARSYFSNHGIKYLGWSRACGRCGRLEAQGSPAGDNLVIDMRGPQL